jgi:hypothetical protein
MGDRVTQMMNIQSEALELFARKNADYGDSFATYGIIGVLIRIQDKIQRALSITSNGINLVEDESISDTLMDLHNYAAMGLMLMEEGRAETQQDSPNSDNTPGCYINFIELDGDGEYETGDDDKITRMVYDNSDTGDEMDEYVDDDISQVV